MALNELDSHVSELIGKYGSTADANPGNANDYLSSYADNLIAQHRETPQAPVAAPVAQPRKKGLPNDLLVGLGQGALQLPSAATGLADIVPSALGVNRPFDRATDYIGEKTGFQPKLLAKQAEQDYSPETQQAAQNINQAWKDPNTSGLDIVRAYLDNPRSIGKTVVSSVPAMLAGGGVGAGLRAAGAIGKGAVAGTTAATAADTLAAGIGEGSLMSGQAMENIDKSVDPQKAALASAGIGVLGGAIGAQSGKLAQTLGLANPDAIIASKGITGIGGKGLGVGARALGSSAVEAGEEAGQSTAETALGNLAENKPLTEGLARNVTEGAIAGAAMGAPAGLLSRPDAKPSTAVDFGGKTIADLPVTNEAGQVKTHLAATGQDTTNIDANAGPLSAAVKVGSKVTTNADLDAINKLDAFANSLEDTNAETETTAISGEQQAVGQATTDQAPDINAPEPALQPPPTHEDGQGNQYWATQDPSTFVAQDGSEWIDESGTLITPLQETKNAEPGRNAATGLKAGDENTGTGSGERGIDPDAGNGGTGGNDGAVGADVGRTAAQPEPIPNPSEPVGALSEQAPVKTESPPQTEAAGAQADTGFLTPINAVGSNQPKAKPQAMAQNDLFASAPKEREDLANKQAIADLQAKKDNKLNPDRPSGGELFQGYPGLAGQQDIADVVKTDNKSAEMQSIVKNDNNQPEQPNRIGEPHHDIPKLVSTATSPGRGHNKAFHAYRTVSDKEAAKLNPLLKNKVNGYKHSIDESSIRHALNEHGNAESEERRGNIAITRQDFEKIPDITANPDSIEYGGEDNGLEKIVYKKRENGHTYVVEEVRSGRGKLSLKTMWKTRTAQNKASVEAPLQTSENDRARSPTGNQNIPQIGDKENSKPEPDYWDTALGGTQEPVVKDNLTTGTERRALNKPMIGFKKRLQDRIDETKTNPVDETTGLLRNHVTSRIPEGTYKRAAKDAIKHRNETGQPVHYISADLGNLSGANAHFKDNLAKVDKEILNPIAKIFMEEMDKAGLHAKNFRQNGSGDEMSSYVYGGSDETIKKAITNAQNRVAEFAKQNGYDKIKAAKIGKPDGIGLHLGYAPILPGKSFDETYEEANLNLKAGQINVKQETNDGTKAVGAGRQPGSPQESDRQAPESAPGQERATGSEPTGKAVKAKAKPRVAKPTDELQQAISKMGGIQYKGHADRAGFTDFRGKKGIAFNLFHNGKGANTLDGMAEALNELGFTDINGENDLIEKLYGSLNGTPHYTPEGAMLHMESVAAYHNDGLSQQHAEIAAEIEDAVDEGYLEDNDIDMGEDPDEFASKLEQATTGDLEDFLGIGNENDTGTAGGRNQEADTGAVEKNTGGGEKAQGGEEKLDSGLRFSKALPENTLAIVHNLSMENLAHADKMGGLAAPSMAVIDKNHHYDSFGAITLVANKDDLGPSKNAKYFNADIYSPRYPSIDHQVNDKAFKHLIENLGENAKKIGYVKKISRSDIESNGVVKGLQYNLTLQYEFLDQQGKAPKLVYEKPKPLPVSLKKYLAEFKDRYDLSRDEGFIEAVRKDYNAKVEKAGEPGLKIEAGSREAQNMAYHKSYEIENAHLAKTRGGILDMSAIDKAVHDRLDETAYRKWLRDNHSDLVEKERIFNGFTYSGTRKYLPHNLDTVVRMLTKDLRGGEGLNYGVPNIRAQVAKQFKTVKSLQEARGNLVTEKAMEDLKKEVNDEFNFIEEELEPYKKYPQSQPSEALAGLASKGMREFNEYYKDVPPKVMQNVADFLNKLKHMPSQYYEGKVSRAVRLNEFSGAIVPNGKEYDEAIEILKRKGITDIRRYDRGDEESRVKALKGFDKLFFSKSTKTSGSTVAEVEKMLNGRQRKLLEAGRIEVVQTTKDLPERLRKAGEALFHAAWHGSAHNHDRFDSSKIGTGEGAQAFGYGHYFSDLKGVAEWYRKGVSANKFIEIARDSYDEYDSPEDAVDSILEHPDLSEPQKELVLALQDEDWLGFDYPHQAIYEALKHPKNWDLSERTLAALSNQGKLYQVELAPEADEYLDWDKPISEQSEKVKAILALAQKEKLAGNKGILSPSHATGKEIYESISGLKSSEHKAASDYLHKLGIRGIRYPAEGGRSDGYNYVIFSDDDITITNKFSKSPISASEKVSSIFEKTSNLNRSNPADTVSYFNAIHPLLKQDEDFINQLASFFSKPESLPVNNRPDGIRLDNRHDVTPNSNVVLDTASGETDVVSPILSDLSNVQGLFDGETIYLVADMLNKDNLQPVLVHEQFHRALQVDPKVKAAYGKFKGQLQARFNLAAKGIGTKEEIASLKRVLAAETPLENQVEEWAAYQISLYNAKPESLSSYIRKAIADFFASIKAFLLRSGFELKSITPADLSALAQYGLKVKQGNASVSLGAESKTMQSAKVDVLNPTIKEAKAILDWVDNGEPIASMKGNEVPRFNVTKDLVDWISNNWDKRTGHIVNRQDIGSIDIDKAAVRTSAGHGLNNNKVQAFYLVPNVIRDGRILGTLPEQPGKPLAILIAAPVKIGGKKFKMYVEVRKDANIQRMYVHEVVLNDPTAAFKILAASQKGAEPQSANRGAIYNFIRDLRNVKLDDDIRFSKAAPSDVTWQTATPDGFLRSFLNKKTADTAIYNLQDRFIDLKRQMQKVVNNGGQIQENEDVRQAEELYHQRAASRIQDFYKDELNPILQGLHRAGIDMDTFQKYLHARHAPSRNKVMAERNPNQATIDKNILEAKAELDRTKSGTSDKKAIDKAHDELARWERAEAFKGTEEERLSLSGMSDTEAQEYINGLNPQKRTVMDGLGRRIDAITNGTLDLMVDYGMEKPDMAESLKRQWEHYVPLYRDEAHPDEYGHPIGRGFSVRGTGIKKALGSNAEVTNILAHIAQQREQFIRRGEKNLVTMRLANFIKSHPDESFAEVGKVPTYDSLVNGIKETLPDPNYKNKDNVVLVRVRGKDVGIVFNDQSAENIRLAMSLKNMDGNQLDAVESIIANGTRWLASVNTQFNIVFGLMNLTRDVQGALVNLSSTPLKGKQAQVFGNMGKALKIISQVERGWDNADPGMKAIYDSFNKAGGTTGYAQMFDNIKDRSKSIQSELDLMAAGKVRRSGKWIAKALSDFNTVMENSTRLSVYMAGIDNGLSEAKSASIAKNITVNFNRKGAQSTRIGAMYAFFNASAQGTARMAETLSGKRGKEIMMAGVALGAATALLGIAAMGADEWDKIPEFVKSRSLILPTPWNKTGYVSIPMPLGLNIFPNIGRVLVESAFGSNRISNTKRYLGLTGDVVGTFNPLGGSDLSTMVMPTTLDIPLALWRNKDWTGKTIYQEDYNSLDPKPGFKRAKDTATTPAKLISEGLGKASGGTDYKPGMIDITPDQIDYVFGQLVGGTGREIQKLEQTVTAAVKGEEVPLHKIPLLGKLAGSTEGLSVERGLFYENLKVLNEHQNELEGLRKEGKLDKVREYLAKYPEARLYPQAHNVESMVKKLKDRKELLEKAGRPTKAVDTLIGAQIKKLNDSYISATKN
jgi:Large polyvalent protein associated domain 38/phage-Barnase-EndoU-ColicinE5/D-RelE like nuclease3/phage-Barnase-EndoU-ColicinE5/D-RelE like nuclease5